MNLNLESLIKEKLPGEVGKTPQTALEEGETAKQELMVSEAKIRSLTADRDSFERNYRKAKNELEKHEILDKREETVRDAERSQRIFELETQLNAQKEISQAYKDFLQGLVRNIEFRADTFRTHVDHPMGDGTYKPVESSSSVTKEAH